MAKVFGLSRDVQSALAGEVWGREKPALIHRRWWRLGLMPPTGGYVLWYVLLMNYAGFRAIYRNMLAAL